ncbi:MAG: NUDIX domain-containing protein [Clostridia bacterium]|nr:NUDIX domain-containing protein [Clostridia bacterium]
MLGKYVRVKVTVPIFSVNEQHGFTYGLNYGEIDYVTSRKREKLKAFIMGIDHPVEKFDGRVIASFEKDGENYLVVSPKSKRYIINDVATALEFFSPKNFKCYYETSCGAIVYRNIKGEDRFLVIKNKRSAHWSFPKGHVEMGETFEETAKREVLEEAGIHIDIIPGFAEESSYMIQNRIDKKVIIFAAVTNDTRTVIQESEIEDYSWLSFDGAEKLLRFENDKRILHDAEKFFKKQGYIK